MNLNRSLSEPESISDVKSVFNYISGAALHFTPNKLDIESYMNHIFGPAGIAAVFYEFSKDMILMG